MGEIPVQLSLTPDSVRKIRALASTNLRDEVYSQIFVYLDRQARTIAGRIARDRLSGQLTKVRTGNLRKSTVGRAEIIHGVPAMRVGLLKGPVDSYGALQELGTQGKNPASPFPTIVPKHGKSLAMPIGPALTPAGVARYRSARDFPQQLEFVPTFRANAFGLLVTEKSMKTEERAARREHRAVRTANMVAAYLLLRSVDITPKYFLRDGVIEALPEVVAGLGEVISKAYAKGLR